MRPRPMIAALVIAIVVAACGGDGSTDTTEETASPTTVGETTGTTPETTVTTAPDAPATTGAAMEGVHVADTDLGPILVDPDGFTLYIFTADTDGASTCYDACADAWPSVPGDTPIGSDLDDSIFGTTTRDDGSDQLTVNGMPLYLYAPDTAPGDTNGQGVNGVWFVVDGSGSMIEAAADDAGLVDYGY
jgi:predicted lipoprotein with Yx(FWY)xxD motif